MTVGPATGDQELSGSYGIPSCLRPAFKDVDSWWTVLVIDPVAAKLLPPMLARPWITPNRVTAASGVLGLASGVAFISGKPRTGALLYEGRFLLDCLDGKLARMQGVKSHYGHFLDTVVDFGGTAWASTALGVWLVRTGALRREFMLLPVGAAAVWAWSQSERWSFINQMHDGLGSVNGRAATADGRGLVAALRRRRLTRLPSSVEAETLSLFLAPLTGSPRVAAGGFSAALAFYAPSMLSNVVRTARTLRSAERAQRREDATTRE